MTLCWLRGCSQNVITPQNVLQGSSIRNVFPARCSPAHFLLQVGLFLDLLGFFCIHMSRSQVYTQRIIWKPEHTETINQMLKVPSILLFSGQLLSLNFSVSGYDEILYCYYYYSRYCISSLKHNNNGILMCMWTYLVDFSRWNPIKAYFFSTRLWIPTLHFSPPELSTISHDLRQHSKARALLEGQHGLAVLKVLRMNRWQLLMLHVMHEKSANGIC